MTQLAKSGHGSIDKVEETILILLLLMQLLECHRVRRDLLIDEQTECLMWVEIEPE